MDVTHFCGGERVGDIGLGTFVVLQSGSVNFLVAVWVCVVVVPVSLVNSTASWGNQVNKLGPSAKGNAMRDGCGRTRGVKNRADPI